MRLSSIISPPSLASPTSPARSTTHSIPHTKRQLKHAHQLSPPQSVGGFCEGNNIENHHTLRTKNSNDTTHTRTGLFSAVGENAPRCLLVRVGLRPQQLVIQSFKGVPVNRRSEEQCGCAKHARRQPAKVGWFSIEEIFKSMRYKRWGGGVFWSLKSWRSCVQPSTNHCQYHTNAM